MSTSKYDVQIRVKRLNRTLLKKILQLKKTKTKQKHLYAYA